MQRTIIINEKRPILLIYVLLQVTLINLTPSKFQNKVRRYCYYYYYILYYL